MYDIETVAVYNLIDDPQQFAVGKDMGKLIPDLYGVDLLHWKEVEGNMVVIDLGLIN